MIIAHQKDNHLYLSFQDFIDSEKDIYSALKKFPNETQKIIKDFLVLNFFSDSLKRHNSYINTVSTQINYYKDNEIPYFFHLYILPKDLNITNSNDYKDDEAIIKIESLSVKLFKLFSEVLDTNKRDIELFDNFDGDSFLQLEANFYIKKLDKIYSYLLNYKSNHKKTIICSDKKIGIEIEELNAREDNPLKNYQFIKTPYQKDLIYFVYSLIDFLKKNRIEVFKNICLEEYKKLLKSVNKINNLLLKISSHKNLSNDNIKKKDLKKYFIKYKNKKEIKQNKQLYKVIKSIFLTQLETSVESFVSIDLTKVFEKVVEYKLSAYHDRLYIGDESLKKITSKNNKPTQHLNNMNYLLEVVKQPKQYPDFLIRDKKNNKTIYHVLDAKYKLRDNKPYDENDIRQILTYAILFNKQFSQVLSNQKKIKKIIVFVNKSSIDLKDTDKLSLDDTKIDIVNSECDSYIDNLFDSKIKFIGINTINTF
ncbi:hypothetical protein HOK00_00805 [bacterium]|jgi:hypothetical protein|nr:hypothetical protein [bacterium]